MKGHITSTVAFENLNPALRQKFRRGDDVLRLGIAAKSNNRCVLQKKQRVANLPIFAQFHQPLLETQTCCVINSPELENGDQLIHHGDTESRRKTYP